MEERCVNCGRRVRVIDGVPYHVWWKPDVTAPGERRLEGTRWCAWTVRPAEQLVATVSGRVEETG